MNPEKILFLEQILLDKECVICYNKFINIKDKDHDKFLDKITEKYNLNEDEKDIFGEYIYIMHYDTRFECLICKNSVCESCNYEQIDENSEELIQISVGRRVNGLPQELYEKPSMLDTGTITCPVCRTKDIRMKIIEKDFKNMVPPEVLYDIKNSKNNLHF